MPKAVLSGQFTANGSSAELDISNYQRSKFALGGDGQDGGGTLVAEVAVDDPPTQWATVYTVQGVAVSLTAGGVMFFEAVGRRLRLTLSGATAPALDYVLWH